MRSRIFLNKLLLLIAGISTALGVGIGAFQAYYWFWYGVYVNISALDAFSYVDEHFISMGRLSGEGFRLLEAAPLALLLVILGLVLLLVSLFLAQMEKH
jgi:hypothetical protein